MAGAAGDRTGTPDGPRAPRCSFETSQWRRSLRGRSPGSGFSKRALCSFSRGCLDVCFASGPDRSRPASPRPCACSLAFGQTPEIALARGSGEQHSLTLFPGPSDSLKKKSRYTEISGFCSPFGSDLRQAFWAWLLRKLKKLLRDLLFLLRFPHSSVLLYRALPAHATLVYLGCIPCTLPIFVPVRNEARTLKRQ